MQVLKFNTNTNKWEPHDDSLTEIGSFGLSRLSDVDVETTPPTDGQVLKWHAETQWKPVARRFVFKFWTQSFSQS